MADERRYLNLPRGANGGAFFWAGADGGMILDGAGPSASSWPALGSPCRNPWESLAGASCDRALAKLPDDKTAESGVSCPRHNASNLLPLLRPGHFFWGWR